MGFDVRCTLRFRPSELHVQSVYTKRIGINQYFFYGLTSERDFSVPSDPRSCGRDTASRCHEGQLIGSINDRL